MCSISILSNILNVSENKNIWKSTLSIERIFQSASIERYLSIEGDWKIYSSIERYLSIGKGMAPLSFSNLRFWEWISAPVRKRGWPRCRNHMKFVDQNSENHRYTSGKIRKTHWRAKRAEKNWGLGSNDAISDHVNKRPRQKFPKFLVWISAPLSFSESQKVMWISAPLRPDLKGGVIILNWVVFTWFLEGVPYFHLVRGPKSHFFSSALRAP